MLEDKTPKHENNIQVSEIKPNKFSGLVKSQDNLLCWQLMLTSIKIQVKFIKTGQHRIWWLKKIYCIKANTCNYRVFLKLFLNAKTTETDFH